MACPSLQTIIEDITCNTDKSPDEQAIVMSMAGFSLGASGGLGFYALVGRRFPSILRHGLGIPLAFGGAAAVGTYLAANNVTPHDIKRAYFRLKT
ncbi:hypothetical protein Ahia01_000168200 [Argonauta hians]